MKIIWITWPAAAGKWTVVDYFVNKLWFVHYSASWYLTEILKSQNKEINRDTMRELADSLRAQYWPSYLISELYNQAEKNWKNAIIESVRTVWEVELLRDKENFILLSIDADQELRYKRAIERNSEKDHISFEKFKEQEDLEAENTDPNKWNIKACQKLADVEIQNNWDLKGLQESIEHILKTYQI